MPSGYYRYPTIYKDTIVFVCEDDLWSVPVGGGVARRLTANVGEVSRPSLSPDGSQIAFVGREEGQAEIYLMPAQGGPAQRLTYLGGTMCLNPGWTPDGKIVFANNARHWYLRYTHLYTVDPQGYEVEQLNYGLARAISYGPNGGVVLGRNTDEPARWKRYRGGTAGQLWIDEDGDGNFRPLIQLAGNPTSPLWIGEPGSTGRVYFISDHEGIGNLYSCQPSGDDLRRHTDHEDYYVRNLSSDGRRIAYHAGADLYLYHLESGGSSLLPVEFYSPQVQRNRKFVYAGRFLQDWALHPKGQHLAITVRGKLFSFANWEAAVTQHAEPQQTTGGEPFTSIRYRLPCWLNDGKRLLAITDSGGEEAFILFNADGSGQPERLPDLDIGRPDLVVVNPKKDQILFSNHRYELVFLDLESKTLKVIDRGKSNPITGFDWSPDGEWAAYSVSATFQTAVLKLWQASSGETFQLTQAVLRDTTPAFDPQGKYIYFISYRTFDPVYDNLQFDMGFPLGTRPYLITLQKDLTSPFIPKPGMGEEKKEDEKKQDPVAEEPTPQGEGEEASTQETPPETAPESPADGNESKPPETKFQIDLEGIQGRIIAFPVVEGKYGRVLGTSEGKIFYTRFPSEGTLGESMIQDEPAAKGTLLMYNLEEQKEEVLTNGVSDFALSADAKSLIYQSGNALRVFKAGEKPPNGDHRANRKSGWIDLGRVKVSIIPGAEWRQMLREAWRLQRDQFWTPDMSQIDWLAIHDRYFPLVDRVSSRSEFSDLMWEMQGELGTSHAYEFGGDYRPEPRYQQGYLGAEYEYDLESDGWRITRIYQGDAWSQQDDSPLNKPGVNVSPGDRLLAINGQRLSRRFTPAQALVNLAGEEVTLSVLSPAGQGEEPPAPRSVTVKTISAEAPALYRQWVEQNRRRVHEATGGRVGYLHIPDMMGAGYAEFHRGYLTEVDLEGLIVDVRFNRGGHVSSLLLEKLARKRLGYDISRWGQIPTPYPLESVLGPMVALTNEFAGSDGDIFSHGFKMMKLGALIGKRTWGGVIGIWPRHALVDGTLTTQPEFSFYFHDVGWGVENYGTDPDIEIDVTPQDYAAGFDAQLERGIQEILKALEANPPSLPDFSQRPSLALPRLPQRE